MKIWNISFFSVFILVMPGIITNCSDSSSPTDPQPRLIDFFSLNPRATYLHTCSKPSDTFYDDGAVDATPILLADLSLAPGDQIRLEAIGDYHNGNDERSKGIAVFTSSVTLLDASELHRIPDAIDAGQDFVTSPTFGCYNEVTDIPEDFGFEPETLVIIPMGATHIFICVRDSYYEDNSDSENDFGVNI